jgi:hypothetical protein
MQKDPASSFLASLFGADGKSKSKETSPHSLYQALSLLHGSPCCESALAIEGYRFLAPDAPLLPLTNCTMSANCRCRYVQHDERRGGTRRLTEFGLSPTVFSGEERRQRKGRRVKDKRSR